MKANELSIGNWVYNKNIDENMQVYPMMLSQMFRQNLKSTTKDYNIFSIPLTPEILEKNGFIKNNNWWFYDAILECYEISIYEISDGIFKVEFRDLEFGISNAEITLCDVHQLQNFLTLCGINKEIKL